MYGPCSDILPQRAGIGCILQGRSKACGNIHQLPDPTRQTSDLSISLSITSQQVSSMSHREHCAFQVHQRQFKIAILE